MKPTAGFVKTSHTDSNLLGMLSGYQATVGSLAVYFPRCGWKEKVWLLWIPGISASKIQSDR